MASKISAAAVCLLFPLLAFAQEKTHVFPQFADGRSPDGTSYRTTLIILPWYFGSQPDCEFTLHGMTTSFAAKTTGASKFTVSIPTNSLLSAPTMAQQELRTGYATLTCTDWVFANVVYSFYSASGEKIGEVTAFPARPTSFSRMIFDARGGMRQAFAIANDTDETQTYSLMLQTGTMTQSATLVVPAKQNVSRFVDQVFSVVPESLGLFTVRTADNSQFSIIGLRMTGNVFSAIPGGL